MAALLFSFAQEAAFLDGDAIGFAHAVGALNWRMQEIGVGNFDDLLFWHHPELRGLLATAVNLTSVVHRQFGRGSFQAALMLEWAALHVLAKHFIDTHSWHMLLPLYATTAAGSARIARRTHSHSS